MDGIGMGVGSGVGSGVQGAVGAVGPEGCDCLPACMSLEYEATLAKDLPYNWKDPFENM